VPTRIDRARRGDPEAQQRARSLRGRAIGEEGEDLLGAPEVLLAVQDVDAHRREYDVACRAG
jgi:hypothetical protein